jgi:hypothetical protein
MVQHMISDSVAERGCKSMEKQVRKVEGLSLEELEAQSVELLPEREEMGLRIRISFANGYASAYQGAQGVGGQVNFNF